MEHGKIFYTFTDEAPALATHSLLPIIQAFASACGVVSNAPQVLPIVYRSIQSRRLLGSQ